MATGTIKKNMVLLWENPNPTANFAAQTISLDLSDYDLVAIWSTGFNRQTQDSQMNICPVGGDTLINCAHTHHFLRSASVSSTGVTFGAGGFISSFGGNIQTSNAYAIPRKIYGIRA